MFFFYFVVGLYVKISVVTVRDKEKQINTKEHMGFFNFFRKNKFYVLSLALLSIAIIVLFVLNLLLEASFNPQINYQGKLMDGSGNVVTDGSYNLKFALYTADSGGTAIWTETRCKGNYTDPANPACSGSGTEKRVSISKGLFSVMLGDISSLAGVDFNQTLYLGVTIGGSDDTPDWDTELSPRKKLSSSPSAFQAKYLDGKTWEVPGTIGSTTPNTGDFTTLSASEKFKLAIVGSEPDASSGYGTIYNYAINDDVYNADGYTKLLLHMNGTNNSTTFTDSSLSPKTVTANGDAKISTAQSKFGGASGYLDGASDFLATPSSSDFDFGTGDFTIDFWLYMPTYSGQGAAVINKSDGNGDGWGLWAMPNGTLRFIWSLRWGGGQDSTGTFSFNQWNHIAFVRNGTQFEYYINGFDAGGFTDASTVDGSSDYLRIGTWILDVPYYSLPGYIDEMRISKGIARWTTGFTPPSPAPSSNPSGLYYKDSSGTRFFLTPWISTGNDIGYSINTAKLGLGLVSPVAGLDVRNSIDAASGVSIGVNFNQTLTATANGDTLTALRINPTFATGSYTGVKTNGLIVDGGNVGIGTSTPNEKFTLAGGVMSMEEINQTPSTTAGYSKLYTQSVNTDADTLLMLHGEGTNGSTTITDSSMYSIPITTPENMSGSPLYTNDTQISTYNPKIGSSSIKFDGLGDYLHITPENSTNFDFGSGDFTIEFYLNFNASLWTGISFFSQINATLSKYIEFFWGSDGTIDFCVQNGTGRRDFSATWNTWQFDHWYHIAVVRSGAHIQIFIDGVALTMADSNIGTLSLPAMSAEPTSGTDLGHQQNYYQYHMYPLGYFDEYRVSKVARYTGNFTPPTEPFTGTYNTDLYMKNSAGSVFKLNSWKSGDEGIYYDGSNNVGIGTTTPAAALTVQSASAEIRLVDATSLEYARLVKSSAENAVAFYNRVSVPGGSPYAMAGTQSPATYLSAAAGSGFSQFDFGTGDFTFAFWVKKNSGVYSRFLIQNFTGNILYFVLGSNIGIYTDGGRSVAFPDDTWTCVFVERTSGTTNYYINNSLSGQVPGTYTANITGTYSVALGDTSYPINAQLDELRVYNRLMTSAEKANFYNAGVGGYGASASGLIAGWHFDEGTGSTAADFSGNSHTLTVTNGGWATGKVPASGAIDEALVWKSINGALSNEKGIQTFGNSDGRTVLDGKTLRFNIAGTEKMQVDANGNLGIGTTSPDFPLDISGNMRLEGTNGIYFGGTGSGDTVARFYNDGTDFIMTDTLKVNSGTNTVYRCLTAGTTLPAGSLTITSSECGSSTDTGLRVP